MTDQDAPIELYHIPLFRSTRAVWMYWELRALYGDRMPGLKIHYLDKDTFRTEKPPEFLRLNPNGKIPVLVHGDVSMWDGTAICHYLLDRFDTDGLLAPRDDYEFRALLYQLSFYASGTVDNLTAISSPVQRVLDNPRPGDNPEHQSVGAKAFKDLVGPILQSKLAGKAYFWQPPRNTSGTSDFPRDQQIEKGDDDGSRFTAIDVIVGYSLTGLLRKSGYLDDFPDLKAYTEKMKQRAAYKQAVAEKQ